MPCYVNIKITVFLFVFIGLITLSVLGPAGGNPYIVSESAVTVFKLLRELLVLSIAV